MKVEPIAGDKKFVDLVHYVCSRASEHNHFGKTILNKTLWFSDLLAYLDEGKSISESRYVKKQFGPVPEKIDIAINELERSGKIAVSNVPYFNRVKKNFVSLQGPDISRLDKKHIDLVNRVMDFICENHSAVSISDESHDEIYHAAKPGEIIPLCAMLAAQVGEVTPEHEEWADAIIQSRKPH